MKMQDIKAQAIAGDQHYGTIEVLQYLQLNGLKTIIKLRESRHRPSFLNKSDFIYNKEKDYYICPHNKILKFKTYEYSVFRKIYKADKRDCCDCPCKKRSVISKTAASMISRFYGEWVKYAKHWIRSSYGKRLLRNQKVYIVGIFGEGKERHLLRRILFRGLKKARIQVILTASVMNLKRLVKELGIRSSDISFLKKNYQKLY